MIRSSTAIWKGTGKNGEGLLTSGSTGISSSPFNFQDRFSFEPNHINPEELLAAAHAVDFIMKLSFVLSEAGFIAVNLKAVANISFVNGSITASHLVLTAEIPGITHEVFDASVKEAELTCPVSRAFGIVISSEATLKNNGGNNHV